jgi:serine/threonine protein kinase
MGLAYDYFNLGSLDKIIHKNILSNEDKQTIFNKLSKGIAYLKQLGISHGDIKPANILLHRNEDGSLDVVIADLGGARSIDEAISDQEIPPLQTPGYTQLAEATLMAPLFINCETEKFLRMSQLRDLFSLGATLFELFTGKVLIEMAQSQDDSAAGFAGFKIGVLCKEVVDNATVEKMIQENQISDLVQYPLLEQALEASETPVEITKSILKLLQINPLNRE